MFQTLENVSGNIEEHDLKAFFSNNPSTEIVNGTISIKDKVKEVMNMIGYVGGARDARITPELFTDYYLTVSLELGDDDDAFRARLRSDWVYDYDPSGTV
jgi:hypothetical protein